VGYGPIHDALYMLRTAAWVGVDLFFVLSGFLISGLMFQELAKNRPPFRGAVSDSPGIQNISSILGDDHGNCHRAVVGGRGGFSSRPCLRSCFFLQNYVVGPAPTYAGSFWASPGVWRSRKHFYFMLAGCSSFLKKRAGPGRAVNIHVMPKLFLWVAIGCTGGANSLRGHLFR